MASLSPADASFAAPDASKAPEVACSSNEPQWAINRRANAINSGLCSLPAEILVEIMVAASLDRVSLYFLRQVCHCFADLFSHAIFEPFHEQEFSLILGRDKRRVDLQSLPLTAFRARLIDVVFSVHTRRARRIITCMQGCESQLVEKTCPETGEVLVEKEDLTELKLCHYCADRPRPKDNKHYAEAFPPSQRRLSDKYMRACEKWFGNINPCNHCHYHGRHLQIDRKQNFDMAECSDDVTLGGEGFDTGLWECTTCFNDLCPAGVNIDDIYPYTQRPCIIWHEWGDFTFQQYDVYYEWKMPLFANTGVDRRPVIITRSMVQSRLVELSEGPYEDLIRLCLGPLASFRDDIFLTGFSDDRTIDTTDQRGRGYLGQMNFDKRNRSPENHDRIDAGWTLEGGNLYLRLRCIIWTASQDFDRDEEDSDESS